MISGKVSGEGSLDDLMRYIARFASPDLVPLSLDIKKAIEDGNREGLLAQTNGDGSRADDLRPSTIKRGRGGFGPPRVPRNSGSQLIDRFRVEVEPNSTGGFRLQAGWVGVPQALYFKTGTKNPGGLGVHMVARNPCGIRPQTRARINELISNFKRKLIARG